MNKIGLDFMKKKKIEDNKKTDEIIDSWPMVKQLKSEFKNRSRLLDSIDEITIKANQIKI
jgi:hypothetical protein